MSGCLVLDLLNVEGAVGQGVREAFAARGCGLQGLPEWSSSSHACRALGTQGWTHAWALQLGSAVRGLGARGWMGPGLEAFDEHAALHTFHRSDSHRHLLDEGDSEGRGGGRERESGLWSGWVMLTAAFLWSVGIMW